MDVELLAWSVWCLLGDRAGTCLSNIHGHREVLEVVEDVDWRWRSEWARAVFICKRKTRLSAPAPCVLIGAAVGELPLGVLAASRVRHRPSLGGNVAQWPSSRTLTSYHSPTWGFFAAYLRAIAGKTGVCSSRGGSVHVARMDAWAAGANGFCGRLHTASVEYGARSRWFNSAAGLCTGSASETASDNP